MILRRTLPTMASEKATPLPMAMPTLRIQRNPHPRYRGQISIPHRRLVRINPSIRLREAGLPQGLTHQNHTDRTPNQRQGHHPERLQDLQVPESSPLSCCPLCRPSLQPETKRMNRHRRSRDQNLRGLISWTSPRNCLLSMGKTRRRMRKRRQETLPERSLRHEATTPLTGQPQLLQLPQRCLFSKLPPRRQGQQQHLNRVRNAARSLSIRKRLQSWIASAVEEAHGCIA